MKDINTLWKQREENQKKVETLREKHDQEIEANMQRIHARNKEMAAVVDSSNSIIARALENKVGTSNGWTR